MELSKEQIQCIENRLENEGVKYWDIKIEMLDHIVTDVEHQLQKGENFNIAVQHSFVVLGWKNSFKQLIERKQIQYQKNHKTSPSYNSSVFNNFGFKSKFNLG